MHRRPSRLLVASAVVLALLGGVLIWSRASEDPTGPAAGRWAARADQWLRAFAATSSAAQRVAFVDRDLVVDLRGATSMVSYGLAGMLDATDSIGETDLVGHPYLSRDGAVVQLATPSETGTLDFTWTFRMAPSGATRWTQDGATWMARDLLAGTVRQAVLTALPARYLHAWATADPGAVASVYTEDASLRDTVAGMSLTGRSQVAAAAAAARTGRTAAWMLRGASLAQLPDGRGDAVLTRGSPIERHGWDGLLLLLDARLTARCRGHVAVGLDLRGDRVVHEERYYRVDDARRCLAGRELPDGWWSSVTVPDPEAVRPHTLAVPGRVRTAVWGDDAWVDSLLLWAYGRFAEAGLPAPPVDGARVETGDVQSCLAAPHRFGDRFLSLCTRRPQACGGVDCSSWRPWARASVLHQLGHVWADRHSPRINPCPAVVRSGPPREDCARPPPDERAERAADVVAWGLMDQPWLPQRLADVPCSTLAAAFRQLTGTAPLQRCGPHDGS